MKYQPFTEYSYVSDNFFYICGSVSPVDVSYFSDYILGLLRQRCKREGKRYPPSAFSIDKKGRIYLKFEREVFFL